MEQHVKLMKRVAFLLGLLLIITAIPFDNVNAEVNVSTTNPNAMGNTSGNLSFGNFGSVAEYDGWIFFTDDGTKGGNSQAIFKVKADGSGLTTIVDTKNDGICGINIYDGWVYYLKETIANGQCTQKLYKITIDGKNNKKVTNSRMDLYGIPTVYKGWIYYSEKDGIYKMKTDGTNKKRIVKDKLINDFTFSNNWIYYVGYNGLYRVKTNGTSKRLLIKNINIYSCQISEKYVYYKTNYENLFRINLDGTNRKKMKTDVLSFNVYNGWIYYGKRDKGFYRMRESGTSIKKLLPNVPSAIFVTKDRIYFDEIVNSTFYYYIVDKDGSDFKKGWLPTPAENNM